MELELDLDNGVAPHQSVPPAPPGSATSSVSGYHYGQSSTRSSPSSGAPSPPDTPISTPLSAYPSPHAFVPSHLPNGNSLLSPYISHPSSPLSTTAASTRQSSPTGFGGNAHQGGIRPNLNLNIYGRSHLGLGNTANSNNVLAHPEEAFNAYARFASDYSSCLPGAQFNGASRDEWERVRGVSYLVSLLFTIIHQKLTIVFFR
jgi:transcription factor SFP1